MDEPGLYEKVLAMGLEPSPSRVRASGSVVPWRRGEDGELEVFWVERSRKLAFMGGFHAFPGGGRLRRDAELPVRGRPSGLEGAPEEAGMPAGVLDGVELEPIAAPGIATCVIRELFEETGVLLASEAGEVDGERLEATRRIALERGSDFRQVLKELRAATGLPLELDASGLVYAGRWLTPPLGPLRFDNRFFLLEWPASRRRQPKVVPGELTSGEWIRPEAAYRRWHQGEVVTAPPILHLLRVLAEDGPEAGLSRMREPAEANLGPYRRIEFRPGVLTFPLRTPTLPPAAYTNAYVLGTREAVLIDPGSPYPAEIEGLLSALSDLERSDSRKVSAIWLTHHHPDHVGGVERLRSELGVPVAAHELTAERLEGRGIPVDRKLADGERIVLDGDPAFPVRVFHTPGHARGHLAFFDESGGSLLGGDLTAGLGTIVVDPPEGDMDVYLQSLERMRDLGARTLFPAHGPPTLSASAKLDEYLEHRLWREEKILEAWNEGIQEPHVLVEVVYDDVPRQALPLAARQLEAHLIRLRRHGLIEAG